MVCQPPPSEELLPPFNGSGARARVLAGYIDQVLDETNKGKVHLIAHSQGGIDCRQVLGEPGYLDKVASLTTVATPHVTLNSRTRCTASTAPRYGNAS